MKKQLCALVIALLVFSAFPAFAGEEITSLEQLKREGILVGVSQGSAGELIIKKELPQASLVYFTDNTTAYMAVAQGKIDAYVYDQNQMRVAIESGLSGVRLLDETLGEPVQVAVGISPVSKIPDLQGKINQFIAQIKADGTQDEMFRRWLANKNETIPDLPKPEKPSMHLVVGTSGIVPPFSYYAGKELKGYDIEMAYRFAAWLGADVQFKVYDYGAIVAAAATGNVDCVFANLNITEERREAMLFSDIMYEEKLGVMVRGETQEKTESSPAWKKYNGKRIGLITGPFMEGIAHENFPDSEYMLFSSYPDLIAALLAGRIDAYLSDEPGVKSVHAEQPRIDYIHDRLTTQEYSFAFRKNDPASAALCEELNAFLALSHENGTMRELDDIWFGGDEERKVVDMSGLTGEKGTVRVVTTSTDMPFSYIKDGKNVGYDIDLVVRFCRYAGYQLELGDVDFSARIPAVQSGKYDFTTDMNVTDERKEQVLFSDPTSSGGVVLAVLTNGEEAAWEEEPSEFSRLKQASIGVQTGTSFDAMILNKLPDAELQYYITKADLVSALNGRKIKAFAVDEPVAQLIMRENEGLTYLSDYLDSYDFAFVFAKDEKGELLRDVFNDFLAQLPAGTLEGLEEKWFGDDETVKTMPDIENFSAENGTLFLATESGYAPFEYVRDGNVVGYDMELAALFCQACGYGLEIVDMNFDGILPAVQTGKCDFAAAGISITPERAESVLFSEPVFSGGTVLMVLKEDQETSALFSDFQGKRAGVITGSLHDSVIAEELPASPISQFNHYSDMVAALKADKIDFFLASAEAAAHLLKTENTLTAVKEPIRTLDIGAMFAKSDRGNQLRAQMDEFIAKLKADGTLDEIYRYWSDPANENASVDMAGLTGENGTLQFATSGVSVPTSFAVKGKIAGTDPDIAVRFCRAYGYGIEVHVVDTASIIPGIETGMYDFSLSDMAVTKERQESVNFSVPYHETELLILTRKADQAAPTAAPKAQASFFQDVATSFNKTFIRENRWRLFLEGIATTSIITLFSAMLGTGLGFLLFMLCRNGNPTANGITRFSMWLVQGTPMVVLLMILYYIIFGSVKISGIVVAIIGFTLTFGAAVLGLIRMGVGMIDRGQYEAAYALGHSNRHTFFKIILPQAIPHVLPAYQGEIVGLIKATAIVGYIAVQDLTKMGDIVRSRTYEAFFPLIAVTVIYFLLEGLFGFLISRVQIQIDPKKRSRKKILKGVKIHD